MNVRREHLLVGDGAQREELCRAGVDHHADVDERAEVHPGYDAQDGEVVVDPQGAHRRADRWSGGSRRT